MATFELFGRMVLALVLVLGLVYALSRLARRAQRRERGVGGGSGPRIDVVARKGLSRTSSVILVRAEGHDLLLGTTSQSVSFLADLTAATDPPGIEQGAAGFIATPAFTPRAETRLQNGPPWTAGPGENRPPTAWDALVNSLRERSVRR